MRSLPIRLALLLLTLALSTWVGRALYIAGHEVQSGLAAGGILVLGTVAIFVLRGASRSALLKVGGAVAAGVLIPVLGQLAYSRGVVGTPGAVIGVWMVLAAVALIPLRGSIPIARMLILTLGVGTYGLVLLNVLPWSASVGSIIASLSGILFGTLEVLARRKHSV